MVKEASLPSSTQTSSTNQNKPGLPVTGNLALKCPKCKALLYGRDWEKNLKVCSHCNYHFKLTAYERIELLADPDSFVEMDADIISVDPPHCPTRPQVWANKLREEREN